MANPFLPMNLKGSNLIHFFAYNQTPLKQEKAAPFRATFPYFLAKNCLTEMTP